MQPSTSSRSATPAPLSVLVAGAGVAGLETTLALQALAGDLVVVSVIAPDAEFVYRPTTVGEPFAHADARRHDLRPMVEGMDAELIEDELVRVDADGRQVELASGAQLHYDALVLALGARREDRFPHATTIDDQHLDDQLHGYIQDVEGGYIHSIAFVIPTRIAWPLPIYELALMTARRAYDMGVELTITIVTPESVPLAIFGGGASAGLAELLANAGIVVETSAAAEVPEPGHVVLTPGVRTLRADRVIALPELSGPDLAGVRSDAHGFIAVDNFCRVPAAGPVYAAGDGTDNQIKHGGLAAQQADTIASMIAADAGAAVQRVPYVPLIRGILLTGGAPKYLTARVIGGEGFRSTIGDTATWSPPAKIAARYLAPYLEALDARQPLAAAP